MNFIKSKLIKIFILSLLLFNPSTLIANDIEKFANKLFKHYKYDDKINNYLVSLFSFKNMSTKKINNNLKYYNNRQARKPSIKLKSKNKLLYNFGNGSSIQINPSNIDNKIIINKSPYTHFKITPHSIFYGLNFDF